MLRLSHVPTLLCFTEATGTVQLCNRNGYSDLPNQPRLLRAPSLHPFVPLLAIELDDRVDVISLPKCTLVATLRGDE